MPGTIYTKGTDQLTQQRKGYIAISLTDFDQITVSEIALGSRIEIAGSIIGFTADESMGNWAGVAAGDVYVYIDSVALTSEYSNTAPIWNTELQGWYDAGNTKRCYARLYKSVGGNYTQKAIYTRSRGILQTYYGLALNTGVNGDQEIRFANDARLLYDDSENVLDNGGMIYRGEFDYAYNNGILLKTQTGVGNTAFYIKKPILAYVVPSFNGATYAVLQAYQNSGWRDMGGYRSPAVSPYNGDPCYGLNLIPGYYRLIMDGNISVALYCTGVFGRTSIVASEIVT